MKKILKFKLVFIIFVLFCFVSVGQTVLAITESPSNPIYDPVVATEKAYYPSVIKMAGGDYRMWYQTNSTASNTTIGYATSTDGLSWTMVTNAVAGLITDNAGHPHVEFFNDQFEIWYWNAVTPYGNTAMHHAVSVDGITWTNDSAITGNLTITPTGLWNSGIYGASDVILNNSPTNVGTNPFDYKYVMYFDATSGGYEQIALGYSADGVAWTLYGTGPVLAKGAAGSWDSGYVAIGSTVIKGNFWTMWYSGGISASNEGIGCATSVDGLVWKKCPNNPIMAKTNGVAWRNNRTYTPAVIRDGNVFKMWFTGRDIAVGNYSIGYADIPLSEANKLYLPSESSGAVNLPPNVSDIVLDNNDVIDVSANTNTASGGQVVIAGVTTTLSSVTSGDLTGVDLSLPKNIGGKFVTVEKAIKLSSGSSGISTGIINSAFGNASVSIPDATTIFAPSGWDGVIAPPVVGSSSGDTPPAGFSIGTVVDIGSPSSVLLFDKPVLVTLVGITGSVGYKPAGTITWTQITSTCGGTYDTPTISAASFPGECSITNGTDTKILTYHLTTFGGLTSTIATLNVVNLVVNDASGTAVSSDFTVHVKNNGIDVSGSSAPGVVTPGIAYSLAAGTYIVSENVNDSYTQSFIGDCDSSGNITLVAGDSKICTIVNTNIPLPVVAPVTSQGGGGNSYIGSGGSTSGGEVIESPVVPLFGEFGGVVLPLLAMTDIPNPLNLPAGPGSVTYNYTVKNIGTQQALADISITDDKCSPVIFVAGDLNKDGLLDTGETWEYSCTTIVSETTINTVVATGYSNDIYHTVATDINTAIVAVGISLVPPIIDIVEIPSQLTPLPYGGGNVTYTYIITNPGKVPMDNITVIDNKCSPITFVSSSAGSNSSSLLRPGETLTYVCQTNIPISTINTAVASGRANGFTSLSYAFSTMLVSSQNLTATNQANMIETINLFKQQLISLIIQLIQQLQVQVSVMIASGQK